MKGLLDHRETACPPPFTYNKKCSCRHPKNMAFSNLSAITEKEKHLPRTFGFFYIYLSRWLREPIVFESYSFKKRIKRSPFYPERVTLRGLAMREIKPRKAPFVNSCFWAPSHCLYEDF